MNRVELNPHCEGVNVVNIELACINSADQCCTRNRVQRSDGSLSCSRITFLKQELIMNVNTTTTTTRTQPASVTIHHDFMHYVALNRKEVQPFLKAIAVNAVGQAITLAAVGIKVKSMTMPDMSTKARCRLALPKGAWVHNENVSQARFLEMTCWQISGAVAEYVFDEFDHYSSLGLEDIEGSYAFLSAYESSHNIPADRVLAGCTVVVEQLLNQHYEVAESMTEQLFKQGSLCEQEMTRHLSGVSKAAIGKQVLAAFQEPWIEEEAERAHRMFIGTD